MGLDRSQLRVLSATTRRLLTPGRLLRWSLGIVYLWFGALKLLSMSPARGLIEDLYPPFAAIPLYCALSAFEVGVGIVLLWGRWTRVAAAAAALHLLGTFAVLVFSPRVAFLPYFPFLTMEGEFVVKNIVLVAAASALVPGAGDVATEQEERPRVGSRALVFLLLVSVGLGAGSAWLHERSRERVAGTIPMTVRMTAAEINSAVMGRRPMMIEGVISKKCRLVGCWLELRDETGQVFVDLAPAPLTAHGFVIGERVTVLGEIGKTREGEVGFVASNILSKGDQR